MIYNYNNLPPFKFFVLQNFPFIEEDFDAITNWQLFCKLGEEINKIINSVNLTGEQVENLTNAFNTLKDYVDNYFENLDVQEEIDNKLDEMAEGGELAEIIAQYLTTQAIIAFNTNNDLKNAENLANGNFARTYGKLVYNDGKGAFYKIRNMLNTDVPDDDNIIALTNDNTLVAEKMPDYRINQIEQTLIPLTRPKNWVFVGDSYADGWNPDGDVNGWQELLPAKLGLSSGYYTQLASGGANFNVTNTTNNFKNLIENVTINENVTDVLVAGGYNDMTTSYENIEAGISAFKTLAQTKYPNAKLHIAFIGWTNVSANIQSLKNAVNNYIKACNELNIHFLQNCEYSLHAYFTYFSSDGIHPNQAGQTAITNSLFNAILFGQANVLSEQSVFFNPQHGATTSLEFKTSQKNNIINFFSTKTSYFYYVAGSYPTLTGGSLFEIGTINYGNIIGSTDNRIVVTGIPCIINKGSVYVHATGNLIVKNGKLYLQTNLINSAGNNFDSMSVKELQIYPFNACFSSLEC